MRGETGFAEQGYTLVELIVALLLFATGALALAGTSAVMGRALNVDVVRERAARVAARQIEILAAGCDGAASGRQSLPQIDSEWSVTRPDPTHIDVTESVSYSTSKGRRTDSYRAMLRCP
jgi:prepilin-type N-terminal cleavage/methylation domain-containing protein